MPALPEGRYRGVIFSSTPSPKHRLHTMQMRLLNGEQIEVVMYGGREHAVVLAHARLRFTGVGKPWLLDSEREEPLPVLNIDLAFDQKYPERNRVLRAARTGEFVPCDVRVVPARADFAAF
jgi:hypothetical protein